MIELPSGLVIPGEYEPPSLAQLQKWQEPIRWDDALKNDSLEDIKAKRDLAERVGVAAIYFTPHQVQERFDDMALLEHARLYALRQLGRDRERLNIWIMGGAAPFASYMFLKIANMDPLVDVFNGYARKSNYDGELASTDAENKEVHDLISAKELVGITEFAFFDDVGETGVTMKEMDEHFLERWIEMNPGLSPTILKRSARWACKKDMVQTGDIETAQIGTEDNTVGFILATPFGIMTGMDGDGRLRWRFGLALSKQQLNANREEVLRTLDILGDRAIPIDQFEFSGPSEAD